MKPNAILEGFHNDHWWTQREGFAAFMALDRLAGRRLEAAGLSSRAAGRAANARPGGRALSRRQGRVIAADFDFHAGARGCMLARMKRVIVGALALGLSGPAFAGASNFTLVNGAGGALAQLSIRRAGTQDWKPLGAAPADGARAPIAFKDPDCAFDIQASVGGSAGDLGRGQSVRREIRDSEARFVGRRLGRLRPVSGWRRACAA